MSLIEAEAIESELSPPFTVALPELLADVPGLTRRTQLCGQSDFYDDRYATAAQAPAIATASFNVTGVGGPPGL